MKNYLTELTDPNSSDVTNKNQDNKEVLTFEDGSCSTCVYVIGVKASRRLSFAIALHL